MANHAHQRIALLSVHPRFADAILRGEKRVEFRRSRFVTPPTHVVLYATAPVGKVVGWCRVDDIDSDRPPALWKKYKDVGGVTKREFGDYFVNANVGYALRIGTRRRLREPLPLSVLSLSRPPQSFVYLPAGSLAAVAS